MVLICAFIAQDCGQTGQHPKNVFVIERPRRSRRIAYNEGKSRKLLSTLIEACASQRRLAISNEEQSDV
jgi:hypothetical protein